MQKQRATELLACTLADLKFEPGLKHPSRNMIAKVGDTLVISLGKRERVTLVDDTEALREILRTSLLTDSNGYVMVTTRIARGQYNSTYLHSRLQPPAPGLVIEHLNREAADNRVANLRQVHHGAALNNRGARPGNATGLCGVNRAILNGIAYYRAVITDPVTKRQRAKSFSSKKYGEEEARRLALAQRQQWAAEFYGIVAP